MGERGMGGQEAWLHAAYDSLRLLCLLRLCRACTTCTEEKWTGVQPEPGTPAYSNFTGVLPPLRETAATAAAVSMSGRCRHGLQRQLAPFP